MSILDELAKNFKNGEPVFKVTVSSNRKEVHFEVKDAYKPQANSDPAWNLLVAYHHQQLDVRDKSIKPNIDIRGAHREILSTIREFTVCSSSLKNPKQSRIYKWLANGNLYNSPSIDGLITLYRYIKNNNIEYCRDTSNPHVKNVHAILELMREKHEHI